MRLRLLDVLQGYNQDSLDRIWELSPQSSLHQHAPHVLENIFGLPSRAGVFRILRLSDLGMRGAELTYEREDPYAIGTYVKGILLGHALLAVQEMVRPVQFPHH